MASLTFSVVIVLFFIKNMSFAQAYETVENGIKILQSNFTQILQSDCHYNTSEITNHIKYINNALDNIKLDYEFQRGSKNWVKKFDINEMKLNETSIINTKNISFD